jgi:redox-sensitive bicupin YhaK (pirin superfamily)
MPVPSQWRSPAGESLQDHQVHERAWVSVIDGEVEITTAGGETVAGGSGLMVEFAPGERLAVRALTTARLLLLLTPWPGDGHPGTMPLSDKATVRQRAAEHRAGP